CHSERSEEPPHFCFCVCHLKTAILSEAARAFASSAVEGLAAVFAVKLAFSLSSWRNRNH
ncbi:MAG TPA: hypothetical protein VHW70_02545, partial [Edaphobacter sp.]|nr:hypothetical protein [Edaphobacter sp.]